MIVEMNPRVRVVGAVVEATGFQIAKIAAKRPWATTREVRNDTPRDGLQLRADDRLVV